MPNIEFFGLELSLANVKIVGLQKQLEAHPALKNMVFTIHGRTRVVDKNLEPRPFARITSTPREDLSDIAKALKNLKLDTEIMLLDKFIPAK